MGTRLDLHELLVGILGSRAVYFQQPNNTNMTYPCIIYKRSTEDRKLANNDTYLFKRRYTVTVIDKNPDSEIPDKLGALPFASFDRNFVADQLNHDIYELYF